MNMHTDTMAQWIIAILDIGYHWQVPDHQVHNIRDSTDEMESLLHDWLVLSALIN